MARCCGRVAVLTAVAALLASGCAVPLSPLSEAEIDASASAWASRVVSDQEPVSRAIDLNEAMARALKYNLDYDVEAVQTALRTAELNLSTYNLLPSAVANAGYASRDTYNASSSFNLITNTPNFGASTSQDKHLRTADLMFSWNILDFGLSYVRARQAGDKVLIGEELKRKIVHRLLEDVRTAYWRAVSSDRLITKLRRLDARARTARANARTVAASRNTSLITSLTYERELVEIQRAVKELQRELIVAKAQLAALMNLKPGTAFTLAIPKGHGKVPGLKMALPEMIATALRNRSELRENLYQKRINEQEAHAALLELLPGLQAYAGPNYDSNSFLFNNGWVGWGAKASWNLLRVFQYPAKREVVDKQDQLLDARALSLTMAIMTQVHVSRIRYMHFNEEVRVADDYRTVQTRLVEQIRAEASAERVSEQTLIREELNTLVAEAKYDIAVASLQSAYANVNASIGLDPDYDLSYRSRPLAEIASMLRSRGLVRSDIKVSSADGGR